MSLNKWMGKLRYMFTKDYYSAITRNDCAYIKQHGKPQKNDAEQKKQKLARILTLWFFFYKMLEMQTNPQGTESTSVSP